MDFQVMTFKDRYGMHCRTAAYPKIPVLFTSNKEARLYWDLIIRRMFLWHSATRPEGSITLEWNGNAQDATEQWQDYKRVAKDWYQAFLPIFKRTRHCPGTRENLAASSMMLRYLSSKFKIAPDNRDHIQLVELAREILEMDGRSSVPGKAVFTFETVSPLFFLEHYFLLRVPCELFTS
jgi:hypothetical protein